MEPCLLALDTATDLLAVALLTPQGLRARCEAGGAQASARLLPLVRELLDEAGLGLAALDAIAFSRGPGAFTGLRAACAAAQGLGFGLGRPLLPLDSLQLVAEDALAQQPALAAAAPLWVAVDARMDEVYAAAYRRCGERWQVDVAPQLYTLPALAAAWQAVPPAAVAGNAGRVFADRLPLAGVRTLPEQADRAAALGRLARAAWADGTAIDPADALPLYLRDKVALTSAERSQARPPAAAAA